MFVPTVTTYNKNQGLEKQFSFLGMNEAGFNCYAGLIDENTIQFLLKKPNDTKIEFFPTYYCDTLFSDNRVMKYGLCTEGGVPAFDLTSAIVQKANKLFNEGKLLL